MRLFRSVFVTAIALTGLTTGAAQTSCPVPVFAMFNICSPFGETLLRHRSCSGVSKRNAAARYPDQRALWVDGRNI